jgi:GntR family transcriptional regulator, rspAB operon transcriptional repressor
MATYREEGSAELVSIVHREQERRGSLSLAQRAYEEIRAGILRGRFPAGSVLAEGALADELGVSKTPVRHALNLLKEEGFLAAGPRRQRIVSAISPERRSEILEVREALERIAVRKACEMRSLEDIDYLRLLLIRQRRAAEALAEDEFIDLDEAFHLGIAAAAHLPIVERMLGNLRGFVRVMRLGTSRTKNHLEQVLAEHDAIVDPIERRDARAAVAALEAHLARFNYTD